MADEKVSRSEVKGQVEGRGEMRFSPHPSTYVVSEQHTLRRCVVEAHLVLN